jgi:hypothetical protein
VTEEAGEVFRTSTRQHDKMWFRKKAKAGLYEYRGYTIGEVKIGPTKRYAVYYNQGMRDFADLESAKRDIDDNEFFRSLSEEER